MAAVMGGTMRSPLTSIVFAVELTGNIHILPPLLAATGAQAQTADELIAKNAAARGGLDKIEAIKTLKFEGKLRFTGGFGSIDLGLVQYEKAPDSVRNEATVQGLTQVQAWDGAEAWQISPFQGRRDPERLSADDAKSLSDDAPISGSLIDYKAKGSQVEYLGTEDVDGTQAYKLKVALKNGDIRYVYLDPDHYLEIRVVSQLKVRGTETETIADYGDYEQVAGVYFPFSIETRSKSDGGLTQISIDKGEANLPVADSLFAFPAAAKVGK
jgi:hypothetical protein